MTQPPMIGRHPARSTLLKRRIRPISSMRATSMKLTIAAGVEVEVEIAVLRKHGEAHHRLIERPMRERNGCGASV